MNLKAGWVHTAVTITSYTPLIQLEQPASVVSLTSDPPEDLTVLRLVGEFDVTLSTTSAWVLALFVQDTSWLPSATFELDADKRVLWSRTFTAQDAQQYRWSSPGVMLAGANAPVPMNRDTIMVDIAPKVKLEAGKALYLVAYEQSGAATFTTSTQNMRLLFQRSGRR